MRETSGTIFSDGHQPPPNPVWAPAATPRPFPMAESGQPPFPEKTDIAQCQFNLRHMPVQALSKELVQIVCPTPAQSLSTEKTDRVGTEYGQGMDSHNGHSPDRENGQGADSAVGQDTEMRDTPSVDSLSTPSEPVFVLRRSVTRWTANQGKVLGFFRQYGHCVTNYRVLVENLDIPYGTVRHIVRRLAGAGYIRTIPYNNAAIQGIEVWYCGPDDAAPRPVTTEITRPADRAGDEQASWTGVGQPPYMERKIEREKNLSIWNLSKEQIRELWPHVCEAGLYAAQLQEVREALHLQGIENQPEKIVAQSLRFLDWQLAKGPIIDQHGNAVTRPVSYWRTSMKRNGFYQKPAGYTDPEEQALRQLVEEENARNAAKRALREAQAEKEKQERRDELNDMLRELADRTTDHALWADVSAKWTPHTRRDVENNPQAIVNSPGIAATTRVALRELLGFITD